MTAGCPGGASGQPADRCRGRKPPAFFCARHGMPLGCRHAVPSGIRVFSILLQLPAAAYLQPAFKRHRLLVARPLKCLFCCFRQELLSDSLPLPPRAGQGSPGDFLGMPESQQQHKWTGPCRASGSQKKAGGLRPRHRSAGCLPGRTARTAGLTGYSSWSDAPNAPIMRPVGPCCALNSPAA